MMTTVAPTAMIAMKLASVAVWIRVYELRKLLTVRPVVSSTCDPASNESATISTTMMSASPACWERINRRRTVIGGAVYGILVNYLARFVELRDAAAGPPIAWAV